MQTVRRLYLYAVSIVSLETVLWGSIGLARSIFSSAQIGRSVDQLAGALSLILVGVPVFVLHWWLAQRQAAKDPDERFSRLRAVFLYGALLATLLPVVQNLLALIDRLFLAAFNLPPEQALLGGFQSFSDNLIAILLNSLFAAYLYSVARQDWQASPQGDAYAETRRLYRYIWVLYGLALLVFGVQQLLQFVFSIWEAVGSGRSSAIANGLALALTGVPLWAYAWQRVQASLADRDEAGSLMRLVVLYFLSFSGVGSVLGSAGVALYVLLRFALGERMAVGELLGEMSIPLSVAVSFGGVWAYYGRLLVAEMRGFSAQTEGGEEVIQRAAGLRRLYYYVLALLGLGATFIGLQSLLAFVIDLLLTRETAWGGGLRNSLASSLAALAVGTPLWVAAWRPMLVEAAQEGEPGDHARRSLVRKAFLYFVLFVAVIGVMFSAGALLFPLLSAALGDPPDNLLSESLQLLKVMLLFALLLVYHGMALRTDQRQAERSLRRRHSQFAVLVLAPDEGDFADQMVAALGRESKDLPVAVHPYHSGAPDETLSAARAVILPAELVAHPSEALRLWLQGYTGERLVVPSPVQGWHWISGDGRQLSVLARKAARAARRLSEGEALTASAEASPWMVVVYILAGLVGLVVLSSLINLAALMLD